MEVLARHDFKPSDPDCVPEEYKRAVCAVRRFMGVPAGEADCVFATRSGLLGECGRGRLLRRKEISDLHGHVQALDAFTSRSGRRFYCLTTTNSEALVVLAANWQVQKRFPTVVSVETHDFWRVGSEQLRLVFADGSETVTDLEPRSDAEDAAAVVGVVEEVHDVLKRQLQLSRRGLCSALKRSRALDEVMASVIGSVTDEPTSRVSQLLARSVPKDRIAPAESSRPKPLLVKELDRPFIYRDRFLALSLKIKNVSAEAVRSLRMTTAPFAEVGALYMFSGPRLSAETVESDCDIRADALFPVQPSWFLRHDAAGRVKIGLYLTYERLDGKRRCQRVSIEVGDELVTDRLAVPLLRALPLGPAYSVLLRLEWGKTPISGILETCDFKRVSDEPVSACSEYRHRTEAMRIKVSTVSSETSLELKLFGEENSIKILLARLVRSLPQDLEICSGPSASEKSSQALLCRGLTSEVDAFLELKRIAEASSILVRNSSRTVEECMLRIPLQDYIRWKKQALRESLKNDNLLLMKKS